MREQLSNTEHRTREYVQTNFVYITQLSVNGTDAFAKMSDSLSMLQHQERLIVSRVSSFL